nr:non-ribosomal peptide synthetase [Caldalkalibacillus mannanilyticus]
MLVSHRGLTDSFAFDQKVIDIENVEMLERDITNLEPINHSSDLVYVIYTSGTTGKPKGVMIEHRSFVNVSYAWKKELKLDHKRKLLQMASFSFDVFAADLSRALLSGGELVICPEEARFDVGALYSIMKEYNINMIDLTPALAISLMKYIEEHQLDITFLDTLIIGSDACPVEDFRKIISRYGKQIRVLNCFGVTEVAVESSIYEGTLEADTLNGMVPIGKPIQNTQILIVDAYDRLQPIGVEGELCIAGDGLARGYLNKPNETKEKFVAHPYDPEKKMYRTGDLARWLEDGTIEYLGRMDQQVKIRGFRIELAEIEYTLTKYNKVQEAVVVAKKDRLGNHSLCAYVVAEDEVAIKELRDFLTQQLPDYMIPSVFINLEQMPMTPNGKIDRAWLSRSEIEGEVLTGQEYVAPRNEIEEKLVQIWSEVLGLQSSEAQRATLPVGIEDSFFELGGHSLRATSLLAKIHQGFNVSLSLKDMFRYTTIREQAELIQQSTTQLFRSIPSAAEKEFYPVSSAQKRMYVLTNLEGAELSYNMPGAVAIDGRITREGIENIFTSLVARHESLRTSFMIQEGVPVQLIHELVEFSLEYMEVHLPAIEVKQELIEGWLNGFIRPFDLTKAPLFRVKLVRIKEEKHLLLFDIHHIISDGTTMDILLQEFSALYHGQVLSPLRIQYKDYSEWQNQLFYSQEMDKQKEFWQQTFAGELPVLQLPLDYPRPPIQSFEGARIVSSINQERAEQLQHVAKETGTTLYMVLLAAYNVLLAKYSGQEEIIVGSPVAGRNHADLEHVIGMFVNTLVFRHYPQKHKTFAAFLEEVKEQALSAFENQDYPFEELLHHVELTRDISRNPLFDTMFVLQNTEMRTLELGGLKLSSVDLDLDLSRFDLTLNVMESDEGISLSLEYGTKLFRRETMERFMGHFKQILEVIVENSFVQLGDIHFLSEKETHQLLYDFNRTEEAYPREKSIAELFEEQVRVTPHQAAVIFGEQALSYEELNRRANQLARKLCRNGVQPDTIVGILMDRSLEMIIGIMGVLKAGGAYLPLDPSYPAERIQYMLQDSGVDIVLSQQRVTHLINSFEFQGEVLLLDQFEYEGEEESNLEPQAGAQDLAYLIYTSGSTGQPKGVMIEHRGVVNLLQTQKKAFDLGPESRVLQFASFSFDASVWEIFMSLLTGASLYLEEQDLLLPGPSFIRLVREKRITTLTLPPAALALLPEEELPDLQTLIVAGEACSGDLARRWARGRRFFNAYGPTEGTVCASMALCTEELVGNPSIGRPILNKQILIVSENGHLQPIGVAGELCIAGEGLARGYLNKPDITKERFVTHPYDPQKQMYRTGDIARWLPDGSIEYLGRMDHQVKIRGYRIELGEIESKLLAHQEIQEAVVEAMTYNENQQDLCAYFTATREISVFEIKQHLSVALANYMIPSHFIQVEQMPLTPNGKIDRKALMKTEQNWLRGTEYTAPRNEAEERLVQIWQRVLLIEDEERIGTTDSFFYLGGDSLKALKLIHEIKNEFEIALSIQSLFNSPTIAEIAENMSQEMSDMPTSNHEMAATQRGYISFTGVDSQNIFSFPPIFGYGVYYKELAHYLRNDATVYAFDFIEEENRIEQYVDRMIELQQEGSFIVLGHSAGGNLAFEVVQELEKRGRHVEQLILVDSSTTASIEQAALDEMEAYMDQLVAAASASKYGPLFTEEVGTALRVKIKAT